MRPVENGVTLEWKREAEMEDTMIRQKTGMVEWDEFWPG